MPDLKAQFRYPNLHASMYFHPLFSRREQENAAVSLAGDGHPAKQQYVVPNALPCLLEERLEIELQRTSGKEEAIALLLAAVRMFRMRIPIGYTYMAKPWFRNFGENTFVPHSLFAVKHDIGLSVLF